MPRTKIRTSKFSASNNTTMMDSNQPKNIRQILEEFDSEKNSIEDVFSTLLETSTNAIETHVLMAKMNLSGLLDTNLYDYIAKCNNLKNPKSAIITSTASSSNRPKERTKTAANKVTKHNNATNIAIVTKHNSAIQAGNNGPPLTVRDEIKHKTPNNRPQIPLNSLTVTPKVNMNEPMSVMRRPNQGEIALSMTGSPLLVSNVSRENMATVSVPLLNGNVLSILPRRGNVMDVSFDENTKNELLLLKGNIEGLLKLNKNE